MNNKQVMNKVNEQLNLDEESLKIFSKIVNKNPIIGKINKEKTINCFIDEMSVDKTTAEYYYEVFSKIIITALKDKVIHPFKNLDK